MPAETPPTIHLKDYAPPEQAILHVRLLVSLHPTATHITSALKIEPRQMAPLVLHGENLELVSLQIDGDVLKPDAFTYENDLLTIRQVPSHSFTLNIEQRCNPQANTALSGLYLSNGIYCTQMEAEGFRRFAFFHDRPDVMATYDVRIEAPASLPVLLSNGNPVSSGPIAGTDRHFAEWHDPHPKPSYLFALVAGDLAAVHDSFTTQSGKSVSLGIYVEKGKEDRCAWAMESLKASMRWDETAFGREYDLEVFNIVAVSDFNMGAMENKGLNVFNDKYILARPDTATDADHVNIERIIAHEYFHNWTGNRITCRDWFQLCLKEGLTVFRDQEFTSDVRSRAVKRIDDVRTLRARQFPEDQGPLAHPVRPSSYIEINNFYTPTVYEKGAEICRMMQTLIGKPAFRKAMDLYFERHDGEAATVEDFVRCMADASGRDLQQFFRWYEQAGTPVVEVATRYDEAAQAFDLTIEQTLPATPGQPEKLPLHLPLAIGLVGADGHDLPLHLEGVGALNTPVLELTQKQQSFRFTGLKTRPILSLNRGFSAPVMMRSDASDDDRLFLMGHDSDPFNRWEAAQTLARNLFVATYAALIGNQSVPDTSPFALALGRTLADDELDDAFKALMMEFPPEAEIAAAIAADVDADLVREARRQVRSGIARQLLQQLRATFDSTAESGAYSPDPLSTGRRALRHASLAMIAAADPASGLALAEAELLSPHSMTSEMGALSAVLATAGAEPLMQAFLERHQHDPLLVDKWLMLSGQIPLPGAAARVEALTSHPLFTWTTPNRVYALIGGFTANLAGFHSADGEGYRVVADAIIRLNDINPQVAARMATGFRSWRQFDGTRRSAAESHMRRILATGSLSRDVLEIITRTLDD